MSRNYEIPGANPSGGKGAEEEEKKLRGAVKAIDGQLASLESKLKLLSL